MECPYEIRQPWHAIALTMRRRSFCPDHRTMFNDCIMWCSMTVLCETRQNKSFSAAVNGDSSALVWHFIPMLSCYRLFCLILLLHTLLHAHGFLKEKLNSVPLPCTVEMELSSKICMCSGGKYMKYLTAWYYTLSLYHYGCSPRRQKTISRTKWGI